MIGQPTVIAIGPPLFQATENVVKQPATIEMIEKEIAKFEKPDQDRFSSCLYPSSANRRSSSACVLDIFVVLALLFNGEVVLKVCLGSHEITSTKAKKLG